MSNNFWEHEDIAAVKNALQANKFSSLFYTLPAAVFPDINPEEKPSPVEESFDPFDDERPLADEVDLDKEFQNPQLTAGDLVMLANVNNYYELRGVEFAEMVKAASEISMPDEDFAEMLDLLETKQSSQPDDLLKSVIRSLVVGRLSCDIHYRSFTKLLEKVPPGEIWRNILGNVIAHGLFNNATATRNFLSLWEKHFYDGHENFVLAIQVLTENVNCWTSEVVSFLHQMFQKLTSDEHRDKLLLLNSFDFSEIVIALLHVTTEQSLSHLAKKSVFFNLLNILAKHYASFCQKSLEFKHIVNHMCKIAKNCPDSGISTLMVRRLQMLSNS